MERDKMEKNTPEIISGYGFQVGMCRGEARRVTWHVRAQINAGSI